MRRMICPYICDNKTEYGYCKTTACINRNYTLKNERKENGEKMKICELKIKDMASVHSIIQGLLLNGYEVQSDVIWKEFPQTGIECFMIAIFDHQAEKGSVE